MQRVGVVAQAQLQDRQCLVYQANPSFVALLGEFAAEPGGKEAGLVLLPAHGQDTQLQARERA